MLQVKGHVTCLERRHIDFAQGCQIVSNQALITYTFLQATVRGQGGVATAPHLAAGVTAGADRLADEATAGEQIFN